MRVLSATFAFLFALTIFSRASSLDRSDIIIDTKSGVSEAVVVAILTARGGKDKSEIWHVDMLKGDVRVQKSRKDKAPYPPGGAVEFWFKNSAGAWAQRPTG